MKVIISLLQIRSYWSMFHNLYNVVILLPLYFGVFWATFKTTLDFKIKLFGLTYLLSHILIIGMTSADWDGRFLMPLLPDIILFGLYWMNDIRKKKFSKLND